MKQNKDEEVSSGPGHPNHLWDPGLEYKWTSICNMSKHVKVTNWVNALFNEIYFVFLPWQIFPSNIHLIHLTGRTGQVRLLRVIHQHEAAFGEPAWGPWASLLVFRCWSVCVARGSVHVCRPLGLHTQSTHIPLNSCTWSPCALAWLFSAMTHP